jgi:PadR family transcriptional regulator PadR
LTDWFRDRPFEARKGAIGVPRSNAAWPRYLRRCGSCAVDIDSLRPIAVADVQGNPTRHHIFYTNENKLCYKGAVKGDRLGEFEELLLLAVQALREDTYGVPIQQYLERTAGRRVSMGAVYAALDRLERKGLVRSSMGESTPERGGKRKRLFSVTSLGRRTLKDVRRVRDRIWLAIEEGR